MRRWNWIESLVLPAAVAVLVTAWVVLGVKWSARAVPADLAVPAIPAAALALLLLGSLWLTRRALQVGPATGRARLGLAAAGVAAVFVTAWWTYGLNTPLEFLRRLVDWGDFISPVFLGVVASAFMWQQGIVLGRSAVPQEHLERSFYGGLAALALMLAVNQARPLLLPGELLVSLLAFLATGLGALALVSVENARRWQGGPKGGGAWPALNRYWLGTVAGVIGSLLLIGVLLAALLSPTIFARLGAALAAAADFLTIALLVMIGAMLVVVAWLIGPLLEQLARSLGENPFRMPSLPEMVEQAPEALALLERYPALNLARRGLSLAVIVVVVGLVFWLAMRRLARFRAGEADEQRESIASRSLLLEQLRNLWRRRKPAGPPGADYLDLSGPSDDPRLMVRRTYQALLAWGRANDLPRRRAGQTPTTYAQVLGKHLPGGTAALEALTSLYAQARYGGPPPTGAEAKAAQEALRAVQAERVPLTMADGERAAGRANGKHRD